LTLSEGLELDFVGIHCEFDGLSPPASTSFEQCHTCSS